MHSSGQMLKGVVWEAFQQHVNDLNSIRVLRGDDKAALQGGARSWSGARLRCNTRCKAEARIKMPALAMHCLKHARQLVLAIPIFFWKLQFYEMPVMTLQFLSSRRRRQ